MNKKPIQARRPRSRLALAGALAGLTALTAGCGMGSAGEAVGQAIADGIACGIVGCRPSKDVASADLVVSLEVRSDGQNLRAMGTFSTGKVMGGVTLEGGDMLYASSGNHSRVRLSGDTTGMNWEAQLAGIPADRQVRMEFVRADGSTFTGSGILPPPFRVLAPTQYVLNLTHPGTPVELVVNVPTTEVLTGETRGKCSNGRAFSMFGSLGSPLVHASGSVYRLDPAQLAKDIFGSEIARNVQCSMTLELLRRDLSGQISPGLRKGSAFVTSHVQQLQVELSTN
ncbi:hypothetical protein LZ017_10680 [Pelomonas sp. CA6]|uniref:hypothetical protein n=1 Tax=Pelomonas sp. CA6 TaxID=2907999 RepID=UPI001F4C42E3|nr:hypothetical protein [Pelomonas sp. CA6]MCH7343843.1 hypothetical protein [Pelomonas sp. CA6]